MNLPRFSIAWIMAMIVIVAIDLAAIRALDGTSTVIGGLIAIGSVPMAGLLLLGLPSLIWGSSGRGESRLLLAGFEGIGWTTLLAYTGSAILLPESVAAGTASIAEALVSVAEALLKVLGLDTVVGFNPAWPWFGLLLPLLILLLPQLVIALIGGWLNHRFEIRMIIKRRRSHHGAYGASGERFCTPSVSGR
jgi:hypothetical protein